MQFAWAFTGIVRLHNIGLVDRIGVVIHIARLSDIGLCRSIWLTVAGIITGPNVEFSRCTTGHTDPAANQDSPPADTASVCDAVGIGAAIGIVGDHTPCAPQRHGHEHRPNNTAPAVA